MESLDELLQRSGQGDTAAFRQLYDATSPRLFALCKRLLRDAALAEDVLQEGFVKVWRNAARFSASKASAMTWITTIIRNQALDKLRQAHSRPTVVDQVARQTSPFRAGRIAREAKPPYVRSVFSGVSAAVYQCRNRHF